MAAYRRVMSPAGWLPRTAISSGTLLSVIEYGLPLPFYTIQYNTSIYNARMVSGKVESEMRAVARAREIARHGSNRRHRKNKYALTFLLWAYYNCDTSTIRVRFDYDSTTIRLQHATRCVRFNYDSSAIQHPTRSYVLSSNNEHVNSFPLL